MNGQKQAAKVPPETRSRALFPASRVQWLKVYRNKKIGEGHVGVVYYGRIKFFGKKPKPVAVKYRKWKVEGKMMERGYFDHEAKTTSEIIHDLHHAGVRMPKFGFVQHEGKTVLVSSLFARRGKSKLKELGEHEIDDFMKYPLPAEGEPLESPSVWNEIARDYARMVNAGWPPEGIDAVVHLYHAGGRLRHQVAEVDSMHYYSLPKGRAQRQELVNLTGKAGGLKPAYDQLSEQFVYPEVLAGRTGGLKPAYDQLSEQFVYPEVLVFARHLRHNEQIRQSALSVFFDTLSERAKKAFAKSFREETGYAGRKPFKQFLEHVKQKYHK